MEPLCGKAINIFKAAVKAVKPDNLILKNVRVTERSELCIQDRSFPITGNVYLVGFGKAVLGMAVSMKKVLGDHLTSGIISVPMGITQQMEKDGQDCLKKNSNVEVLEGAVHNLPDEKSLHAARLISNLVSSLKEQDLLLVLISGGASALLPAPLPGITLQEKLKLIKLLTSKGANIQELNVIRKRLSTLKGGGLAQLAKPAKVVSLILSDIIGNPLDLIGSAPTVANFDDPSTPMNILKKYSLVDEVSKCIISALEETPTAALQNFDHVTNIIIGNNEVAISAAAHAAQELGYIAVPLSLELQGVARTVAKYLVTLAGELVGKRLLNLKQVIENLKLPEDTEKVLFEASVRSREENKGLCLLCGGETVVEVSGSGTGGRNQELALAAALELQKGQGPSNLVLLSAGTDGIDGPTPAAGALATSEVVEIASNMGLNASEYLENNDSFTFYKQVCNGKWHVITGHTGTNVMDVVLILVDSTTNHF